MSRVNVSIKLALAVSVLCVVLAALITSSNIAKLNDTIDRFGAESINLVHRFGEDEISSAEQDADLKLKFIVDLIASVAGDALASYNIEMLEKIASAVLVDPSIAHIKFKTSDEIELTKGGTLPEPHDAIVVSRKVEANGVELGEVIVTRTLQPLRQLTQTIAATNTEQENVITELSSILLADTVRSGTMFGAVAALASAIAVYAIVVLLIGRPLTAYAKLISKLTRDETDFGMPNFAERKDEIGQLGLAIDLFRKNLLQTRELQRVAVKRQAEEQEKESQRQIEAAEQKQQERQVLMEEQSKVVKILAHSLQGLSLGDLDVKIQDQFDGPYENLRVDFNTTVDALKTAIAAVAHHSSLIRAETSEISSSTTDLAARTERQAATLEETATALDELSVSVKSASESAQVASGKAESVRTQANNSGEIAVAAVDAMQSIKASSDQISNIVKIIDDIAFQTNLLALNAAVEAARAGEAGRGFAIVATEVRALAKRSANAAQEISQLIQSSEAQVQFGVDLVQQTGTSLGEILSAISEVSDLMANTAVSTKEQATSLSEVNDAITQLDQVTQHNGAMFEKTTAVCHALNSETNGLVDAVSHFKNTGLNVDEKKAGSDMLSSAA